MKSVGRNEVKRKDNFCAATSQLAGRMRHAHIWSRYAIHDDEDITMSARSRIDGGTRDVEIAHWHSEHI